MKRVVRSSLRSLLDSRPGRVLRGWLQDSGPARRSGIHSYGGAPDAEVVAYFGDGPDRLYQLRQWVPALERLNENFRVVVVLRNERSFAAAKSLTDLPLVLAVSQPDLIDLYTAQDYRLAIYVNNSMRNFQSMAEPAIIHVHVDHGESDKTSSISNQLKAYDKVFVAGPAAKERCERVLWGFDETKLVEIGRPPLDGEFVSVLPRDSRQTVVYAPTWEGENDSNNFTSVDVLGLQIIESLLAANARVVYRPHPRTADLSESDFAAADRAIRAQIDEANESGGSHVISAEENILDLFVDADVLIADISSVGLDFLYLHPEKGLILTDRHNDPQRLEASSPIASKLESLSLDTIAGLPRMLESVVTDESQSAARRQLKEHYFGVASAGEATELFVEAVENAVRERESTRRS
ncbi:MULTISPECIES: CDP-glycerol glycerophosphotransferase family protein [unclassified Brevibacterium]|uniref:CDP-glycerol glycerophosphotransferase family protein n=1 Tax=unclassified Brevibacterium TaxID=2614124 RepID=UPI001E50C1EC|nr:MULTISPECIES: CDP-glycerol glycerophosphotransferase family protein [unclassified Brevibacterium]MCD1285539.1 CDP-glycerol--glycerophosphate glycerophosphotransferase [Brevibacterium sp. CCUG 69071]MDK8434593.1 CDP-glycerol glycerophosphotransferase family protein [Brevibacterium sp. H-BE7]